MYFIIVAGVEDDVIHYVQVLLRSYSRAWGMCETGWRWLTPRVAPPTFQRGRLVGEFGDGVAGVT